MWSAACTASAGRTETKAPDAEGNLTACRTRADNFAIESSGLPSASFADPLAQGAAVKTAAPVEFIERDGFAFVASDAEVQFRAKSAKTQQTMLNKCDASSDISPSAAAAPIDADATVSFAAFAPNAKPPAFQDAKNSSRSACADLQAATPYTPPKPNLTQPDLTLNLQAASQSLSEVLKQVDAVLSQSAASPAAAAPHVTLPSPSLRRVSVSNIVSNFEQNKVSPPVVPSLNRETKRASFPPLAQFKGAEAEAASDSLLPPSKDALHAAVQPPSPIAAPPSQTTCSPAVQNTATSSCLVQQHLPALLPHSPEVAVVKEARAPPPAQPSLQQSESEAAPIHTSPKAAMVLEECVQACAPATKATASAAAAVARHDPAVLVQHPVTAAAAPVTVPPPPAGARYTFEDVERITTFAKEELQRRADAEVAALTTQLAARTSETQTLSDENAVLKDTLQQ